MTSDTTRREKAGIGALALSSLLALGAAGVIALRRASRLPTRDMPEGSPSPMPDASDSRLARSIRDQADEHPGLSGVHLLEDGIDAFAARLLLVRNAERRLDVQYYIWHGDRTGTLLLEELHRAAERGVKVNLLLDDNGISGLDHVLSALDQHPNIEIRLFNPFPIRFPKALGFLTDFDRLNRRMHNKSLTVDHAVTIVGGRNVGDEYFAAGDEALFVDLDVLAVGPVVADVERDFDRYWHSRSVYAASSILPKVSPSQRDKLTKRASIVERDAATRRYVERMRKLPLIAELTEGTLDLEWTKVRMLSDDPAKGLGDVAERDLLLTNLERSLGPITGELGLVSGYFVPGEEGAEYFIDLVKAGVSVTVLTNGYAANDVGIVHAGYVPYRHRLVSAGVRLFEMQPWSRPEKPGKKGTRIGIAKRIHGTGTGSTASLRSGATTLHAKTFTVDRERLFVGSFNFDPRSVQLNTEIGFLIESPALATRIAEQMIDTVPQRACEVIEGPDGDLRWRLSKDGKRSVRTSEPGMNLFDHALIAVARRLPIARLL